MKEIYEQTESFLRESKACREAFATLKEGSCIQLLVDERIPIAIIKEKKAYQILREEKKQYDLLVKIHPDALRYLNKDSDLELSEFCIRLLQQSLIGKMDLQINSSLLELIRKGYFKVLLLAGSPFHAYLRRYGLKQMRHIYQWVENKRTKKD